jgi:hypothetical protein
LEVTNNDEAEDLIVETSGISGVQGKLRPRWSNGQETRILKRGESDTLSIMCLEPAKPNLIVHNGEMRLPLLSEWRLKPWKERLDSGSRLVRFYGQDEAHDRDSLVSVNGSAAFVVSILTKRHRPVQQNWSYGVAETCMLVVPFNQEALERANANSSALAEQKALLAFLESKEQEAQEPL